MKKPLFIVIEGLDGSGKSTAGKRLTEVLEARYQAQVLLTYEPHNPSCGGDYIRQVLTKKITQFRPRTLALAFAANRLDHCDREIIPWLEGGENRIAISDRYYLSSLVYQSTEDFPMASILKINELALKPDLIFFLNVSNEVCYERMKKRNMPPELFEENLEEIRRKYLAAVEFLRNEHRENIVEIDGNGTVEAVVESMIQALATLNRKS